MREIYYNIVVRRQNAEEIAEQCGYEKSISKGFLKVEFDKSGLKNIEGLLNPDYIGSEIAGNEITLNYYVPTKKFRSLRKDTVIVFEADELEFPINFENANNIHSIEIKTLSKISDKDEQRYYNARLQEFKREYFQM